MLNAEFLALEFDMMETILRWEIALLPGQLWRRNLLSAASPELVVVRIGIRTNSIEIPVPISVVYIFAMAVQISCLL